MLFQIQTWLALKTKMSRKEIKPTEDIKEDDDDDPGFAKLMDNWDDLIKELESVIRSLKTKKTRKREKDDDDSDVRKLICACDDLIRGLESDIRSVKTKKSQKKDMKEKPTDEGSNKKMHKQCSIPRKRQKRKKKCNIRKIKDEGLNIVSINARGAAKKKKASKRYLIMKVSTLRLFQN